MWYLDYSFLQFIILSNLTELKTFLNQKVLLEAGRLVRKDLRYTWSLCFIPGNVVSGLMACLKQRDY